MRAKASGFETEMYRAYVEIFFRQTGRDNYERESSSAALDERSL